METSNGGSFSSVCYRSEEDHPFLPFYKCGHRSFAFHPALHSRSPSPPPLSWNRNRWFLHNLIGAFAAPDKIHWAPGLPKTRSGKIMRRILTKIASRQLDELGDTSTLAEPSVVD